MATSVFIVDCPTCKAKVGAEENGRAEHSYWVIAHVRFEACRERTRLGCEFFHCGRGANMSQPMDDSAA